MTPHLAKKMLQNHLEAHQLSFHKLTARTIGFSDLARGDAIFVKIHGWQPSPAADEVRDFARNCGFCVDFGC